jgi:hypothetical protein
MGWPVGASEQQREVAADLTIVAQLIGFEHQGNP